MSRTHLETGFMFTVLLLAACGNEPFAANGIPSRTLSVRVGQELDLTLQTIGPGQYESPPTISSPSIRFLDVALAHNPVHHSRTKHMELDLFFVQGKGAH